MIKWLVVLTAAFIFMPEVQAETHYMGSVSCNQTVCMDEDSAAGKAIVTLYGLLDCPGFFTCQAVQGDRYEMAVHVMDLTVCKRFHYVFTAVVVGFVNGYPIFDPPTTNQHCYDILHGCLKQQQN